MKEIYYNIKRGIQNFIYWLPVIWKDRDWDSYYILEILRKKIIKQAEYNLKVDRYVGASHDSQRMMLCARLIEKVNSEYYHLESTEYYQDKILTEDIGDGRKSIDFVTVSENYDEYLKKYPSSVRNVLKNPKNQIYYKNKQTKKTLVMDVSFYNHKKAKRILFNLLMKDIESWWN